MYMSTPLPSTSMHRKPPQSAQEYYAVPQNSRPPSMQRSRSASRPPARSSSIGSHFQSGRGAIAQGVATGAIGGGYGPYSVCLASLFFDSPYIHRLIVQPCYDPRQQPFSELAVQRRTFRSLLLGWRRGNAQWAHTKFLFCTPVYVGYKGSRSRRCPPQP